MAVNMDNFWTRYSTYCLQANVCPLKSVVKHLKGSELCCPVESVRPEHWLYLLSALYKDSSLTKIHFASYVSPYDDQVNLNKTKSKRRKTFPIPYGRSEQNITNICSALGGMLQISEYLVFLKLEFLSLKVVDAEQLSYGLRQSQVLKELSFSGCKFEDGAVGIICQALHMIGIAWIDFSSCALKPSDIDAICKLIKTHVLRRSNDMFAQTLRYRFAVLDTMAGLNRISINCNSLDKNSVKLLVESLTDDLWIKALDLQNCNIENEGAEDLLKLAKTNGEIEIIDLRLNNIDANLVTRITQQLSLNKAGKNIKYFPMPLWSPSELVTKYSAKVIKKRKVPKSSPVRIKIIKRVPKRLNHSVVPLTKKKNHVKSFKTINVRDASIQTDESTYFKVLSEQEFNDIRKKIIQESRMRKFFMDKYDALKAENYQLHELLNEREKDDIYIDHETYYAVKRTFEKLQIFFEVMKRYGLWEYIATLGFHEITTISLTEDDSQKSVKMSKKMMTPPRTHSCTQESKLKQEFKGPCCNCHREEECNNIQESSNSQHHCPFAQKPPPTVKGGDNKYNEKVAIQRIFQDMFNHYSEENQSISDQQTKPAPTKQKSTPSSSQDNAKSTSSKQSDPISIAEAHMFIKKFSYANMPKKLKDLISPADFYKIVKRELERCDPEAAKSHETESTGAIKSESGIEAVESKLSTLFEDKAPIFTPPVKISLNVKSSKCERPPPPPHPPRNRNFPNNNPKDEALIDDIDDISIKELIARRQAMLAKAKQLNMQSAPTKKQPVKVSSNMNKNSNSQGKQEKSSSINSQKQPTTKSSSLKQKVSNASQTSNKVLSTSNVSSDEINSSDSIATSSDKLSDSSLSRSSSNRSLAKTDDQNENESQKSYIETVSDASTFKDVESISDIEVNSLVSSKSENGGEKNEPSAVKDPPAISTSKVDMSKSSSSKSVQSNSSKGKKGNKHGKNRPKSSSKSSSVPSLSDITTVSSKSLNTDSVMKQLSGSGEDAKK